MPYRPRYRVSQVALAAAEELGAARAVVELLPLPLAQVRRLRRRTLIRVAHNSTWIENRALALEQAAAAIEAAHDPSRSSAENEVRNYFEALQLIDDNLETAPDEDWMRRLHAVIMRGGVGRPRERSAYRTTTVQVGNVYIAPAAEDVPGLMAELGEWATAAIDTIPDYLFAAILAYRFVTIHPFVDGNGRTCRALATWALRRSYDPKGLLNVEEFYVRDLDGYYSSLQMGLAMLYYASNEEGSRSDPDLTEWIDYFCRQLAQAARQMRDEIVASFRERHPELRVITGFADVTVPTWHPARCHARSVVAPRCGGTTAFAVGIADEIHLAVFPSRSGPSRRCRDHLPWLIMHGCN